MPAMQMYPELFDHAHEGYITIALYNAINWRVKQS